jgi:enoyl-CoA hydratase/carnithine racemase
MHRRPIVVTMNQTTAEKTMAYETILTEQDGAAFVITFNRPDKRNALSVQTIDDVADAVRKAAAEPSVRAIIFTGSDKVFSAGADLNEALQVKSATDAEAFFGRANRVLELLESTDKPVLAAIEGFCMTGGCELALACDIRIGAKGSSYAITSSRIGTVAGFGGTQRLPRIVGMSNALDMLFLGDPIDAQEAHRIGLINRLTEKGEALKEAKRLVSIYEKRGPLSLAFAKRAVRRGMQMDQASAIDLEFFMVNTIYGTEDKHEGIAGFLEKRDAKFKGR